MPGSIATPNVTAATHAWPRPLNLGLRLILAYALVIWLAQRYGRAGVEAVMPLFRNLIASLDEHERVLSLAIVNDGADTLVRMTVKLTQDVVINGRAFEAAGYTFISSIGIGLILQPAIVAFGLILAWPAQRWREYPLRIATTLILLALVLASDAPLTLWANYLHTIIEPGSFSLLWLWEEFLVNGGRLALGLVIALAAIKMPKASARRTISATNPSL